MPLSHLICVVTGRGTGCVVVARSVPKITAAYQMLHLHDCRRPPLILLEVPNRHSRPEPSVSSMLGPF